jgi:hypothetical protein
MLRALFCALAGVGHEVKHFDGRRLGFPGGPKAPFEIDIPSGAQDASSLALATGARVQYIEGPLSDQAQSTPDARSCLVHSG